MAIKVSELNKGSIYYRRNYSGPNGICRYMGEIKSYDHIRYRFRFDSGRKISTSRKILENSDIYTVLEGSNILKSW